MRALLKGVTERERPPARVQRAAECSPGREPGGTYAIHDQSPDRGERPSEPGLDLEYFCRPLRGLNRVFAYLNPGLAPGATFCRQLRWLVESFKAAGLYQNLNVKPNENKNRST